MWIFIMSIIERNREYECVYVWYYAHVWVLFRDNRKSEKQLKETKWDVKGRRNRIFGVVSLLRDWNWSYFYVLRRAPYCEFYSVPFFFINFMIFIFDVATKKIFLNVFTMITRKRKVKIEEEKTNQGLAVKHQNSKQQQKISFYYKKKIIYKFWFSFSASLYDAI